MPHNASKLGAPTSKSSQNVFHAPGGLHDPVTLQYRPMFLPFTHANPRPKPVKFRCTPTLGAGPVAFTGLGKKLSNHVFG